MKKMLLTSAVIIAAVSVATAQQGKQIKPVETAVNKNKAFKDAENLKAIQRQNHLFIAPDQAATEAKLQQSKKAIRSGK